MRMYEDKPMHYDNWDIDIFYTEKYWDATDLQSLRWTELGEVRATVELERKISRSRHPAKDSLLCRHPAN